MSMRAALIGSLVFGGVAALMAGGLPQATTTAAETARAVQSLAAQSAAPANEPSSAAIHRTITTYCAGCHNSRVKSGELVLDTLDTNDLKSNAEIWEKV